MRFYMQEFGPQMQEIVWARKSSCQGFVEKVHTYHAVVKVLRPVEKVHTYHTFVKVGGGGS